MAKLNRAQRNIVIAAALLIIVAWLFPPYQQPEVNDKGTLTGWHIKWELNKHLRDSIRYHTAPHGSEWPEMVEYLELRDLQLFEVVGVLVIAGVAYLITKKKRNHNTR